jgi:hypothetical protein
MKDRRIGLWHFDEQADRREHIDHQFIESSSGANQPVWQGAVQESPRRDGMRCAEFASRYERVLGKTFFTSE